VLARLTIRHLPSLSICKDINSKQNLYVLAISFPRRTTTLVSGRLDFHTFLLLLCSFDALLVCFDTASVGLSKNVVDVLHVGGTHASYLKLVLQREPRPGKPRFRVDIVLPNEEQVDEAFREL
jgi:hypothetical protein